MCEHSKPVFNFSPACIGPHFHWIYDVAFEGNWTGLIRTNFTFVCFMHFERRKKNCVRTTHDPSRSSHKYIYILCILCTYIPQCCTSTVNGASTIRVLTHCRCSVIIFHTRRPIYYVARTKFILYFSFEQMLIRIKTMHYVCLWDSSRCPIMLTDYDLVFHLIKKLTPGEQQILSFTVGGCTTFLASGLSFVVSFLCWLMFDASAAFLLAAPCVTAGCSNGWQDCCIDEWMEQWR